MRFEKRKKNSISLGEFASDWLVPRTNRNVRRTSADILLPFRRVRLLLFSCLFCYSSRQCRVFATLTHLQQEAMNLFNYQYLGHDHLQGLNDYKVKTSHESHLSLSDSGPLFLVHCSGHLAPLVVHHATVLELLCRGKRSGSVWMSDCQVCIFSSFHVGSRRI